MYIFDTDHLSLIQRNGAEGKRILGQLLSIKDIEVATTVITYEEQVKGRLLVLAKAKTLEQKIYAYEALHQLAVDYQSILILPFTRTDALENQRLRSMYPRLGKMDLKIASIALIHDAILLTRNKSDFGQIQGLKMEDWSA